MKRAKGKISVLLSALGSLILLPSALLAHAPSGAIFTTVADGTQVNANIYPDKESVYLDGGPGPGAPASAAGLDDGTYVFQVTNPNGRELLSTDPARCRQFEVFGGIIVGVVPAGGCEHVTGFDVDYGAATVQLFPYLDTPNPGGVYKVWAVRVEDFLDGCAALGEPNGLDVVDCGSKPGNLHGFVPAHSKTDNFKVGQTNNLEIDVWFYANGTYETIPGMRATWFDTLGVANRKWSYLPPTDDPLFEDNIAHVEAVEKGTHYVMIEDQPGCRVIRIQATTGVRGQDRDGPGMVSVRVRQNDPDWTKEIYVFCDTSN